MTTVALSTDRASAAAIPILFVSDDADLRAAAVRVLGRAGFEVIAVAHVGHATLACIERPGISLLIIEDDLPDGNGVEAAGRLRRYAPDLRVVRMCNRGSGAPGPGVAVRRPFTADDLLTALADAMTASAS